ncbi:MAG: hypothetical protein J5858_00995 [Lentisphaeria bacterium]|nr:hypothetical protein [Lentisphaeria bacterium]
MRKSVKKWNVSVLILLFISSFMLHDLIHGSFRCSTDPGIRIPTVSKCVFGRMTGSQTGIISLPADRWISDHEKEEVSADIFCLVCAGWLTAEDPSSQNATPIFHCGTKKSPAYSTLISTPAWLLPSPRAPPEA